MKLITCAAAVLLLLASLSHAQVEQGKFDQEKALAALESDSEYRRQVAAEFLAKLGDEKVIKPLVRHMHSDPSVIVRRICIAGLTRRNDKSLVPEFIKVLKAEDTTLRFRAVFALGALRTGEGYKALLNMLKDPEPEVRAEAVRAIAMFAKKESMKKLANLYKDEDAHVRRTAVEKIAKIGGPDAVDSLIPALKNDDPAVVRTALEKLGKLKAKKAVPHIIPILQHENASLREAAAISLGLIGDPSAVKSLVRLFKDENLDVRRATVEAVSRIGGTEVVDDLMPLLDDPDTEVRKLTLRALIKMKVDSDAFKAKLRYIAKNEPHTYIREIARQALNKLEKLPQQEGQKTTSPPITATLEPLKFETVIGEPVVLVLRIHNNTDQTIRIDLGYKRLTAFKFKIFDVNGDLLNTPPQYESRELRHIYEVGGPIIGVVPKEAYKQRVVLDRWYQPKTTGSYKVMCEFEANALQCAIARAHRQPIPLKSLPGYVPIPACETTLKKLPYDEAKIRAACDKYLEHALKGNVAESRFAVDYLAFCHTPISDEYLLRFLDKLRWPTKALRYLVERRTEVSEEALLELHNDDRVSDWAKKDMIRILRPLCYDTEEEPRLARNALEALKQIGDEWAFQRPDSAKEQKKVSTPEHKSGVDKPVTTEQPKPEAKKKPVPEGEVAEVEGEDTNYLLPGLIIAGAVLVGATLLLLLLRRSKRTATVILFAILLLAAGCTAQSQAIRYRTLRISGYDRESPPTDIKLEKIQNQPFLVLCAVVFGDWTGSGGDEASPASDQYFNVPDVLVESVKQFARFIDSVDMPPVRTDTAEQKFFSAVSIYLQVNYYGIEVPYPEEATERNLEYERMMEERLEKQAVKLLREVVDSGKEPFHSYALYFLDVWRQNTGVLIELAENEDTPSFLRFSALCKLAMRTKSERDGQLSLKYSQRIENKFKHMKGWRPDRFWLRVYPVTEEAREGR